MGRLVDLNKNTFIQSSCNNENKSGDKNETTPANLKSSSSSSSKVDDNFIQHFQFTSRHAMDGKYLFVDQRATFALGFLPQELLGTSMYEYFKPKDIAALAESHKGECRRPFVSRVCANMIKMIFFFVNNVHS